MKKLLTAILANLLFCCSLLMPAGCVYAQEDATSLESYFDSKSWVTVVWRFVGDEEWSDKDLTASPGDFVEVLAYYFNDDSVPHTILGGSLGVPNGFEYDEDYGVGLMTTTELEERVGLGVTTIDIDIVFADTRVYECANLVIQPGEAGGISCRYHIFEPTNTIYEYLNRPVEVGPIYATVVLDEESEDNISGKAIMANIVPTQEMVKEFAKTLLVSGSIIGVALVLLIIAIVFAIRSKPKKKR